MVSSLLVCTAMATSDSISVKCYSSRQLRNDAKLDYLKRIRIGLAIERNSLVCISETHRSKATSKASSYLERTHWVKMNKIRDTTSVVLQLFKSYF